MVAGRRGPFTTRAGPRHGWVSVASGDREPARGVAVMQHMRALGIVSRMWRGSTVRTGARGIALASCLALTGCLVEYEDDAPAGLSDVPARADDDELVYERELRWWVAPNIQRARLYRRVDGSYLLLRQRWQGHAVYGWSEATLNDVGVARRSNALAVADPTDTAPIAGNYDCTYVDALPAVIHVEDQRVEYLSLCPPEGLVELARFYEDVVELMLECPLDGSWYADELPLAVDDCAAIE
jgi:hypothetical protein